MLRKTSIILLAGFTIQFLISCRECGPAPTFNLVHTALNLNSLTADGRQLDQTTDSVRKEDFRLEILLVDEEDRSQISGSLILGFNSAQALDCPPPNYFYRDKLESIKITMRDALDASQSQDATDLFVSEIGSTTYTIQELVDMPYNDLGQFFLQLSLVESERIYKTASFSVTATLESGESFTQETEEIIFID